MEKEELQQQLAYCPLRIRMNDGREYLVENRDFIMIGDYAASVLYRREDGKLLNGLMGLMNITMVEPLGLPGDDAADRPNGSHQNDS